MAVWSVAQSGDVSIAGRIDSDFFHPEFLDLDEILHQLPTERINRQFSISDGNHISISRHFTPQGEVPYFRGQDINNFFLENSRPIRIPQNVFDSPGMKRSHFIGEDVLICIVGASTGTIGLVSDSDTPATGSCKIGIIRKKNGAVIDPLYLAPFLMGKFGQYQVRRHSRGTAQGGLILIDLMKLSVPVLPWEQQQDIRALVSSSVTCNSVSRQLYTQAQQLLESELGLDKLRFDKPVGYTARFSELELSHRTDAQHYQPRFTRLLEHLARFPTRRIRDIRRYNRRGIQPVYVDGGTHAVVNSQHLGPKHIDYDGLQKTTEHIFNASPEAHIQPDDLLIYTTGAYIGRTNVYLDEVPAFASNHVNILRLSPDIDHAYMAMVFQSIIGQFQTQKHARGSAQAELYPADIDKFVVPLLPPDKQQEIGNLVRESLAKQRESAQLLDQAKSRVEQLIEEAVRA